MSDRLDTSYAVHTPEGIALRLSPAGVIPRFLAWAIDLSIRIVVNIIMIILLANLGSTGIGIALIVMFLLEWFYPVYFELRHGGQTPGKKALGLYVAQEDATPISPASSVIRNLLRVVDFLPLLYAFGLISMLMSGKFQRLGDLVAKTVVLYKDSANQEVNPLEWDKSTRPPVKFTLVEQQALIAYSQRSKRISDSRLEELAKLTGSLTEGKSKPVNYLLSLGNYLTGRSAS